MIEFNGTYAQNRSIPKFVPAYNNENNIVRGRGHMEYRVSCPACDIWGEVVLSGDDCTIVIKGGSAPHIGSVCLAVPRPSLTGSGTSATVSVLNRTGHMDDSVACAVAKHVAAARNCAVACACGIHIDNASAEAIAHIQQAQADIVTCVLDLLETAETE